MQEFFNFARDLSQAHFPFLEFLLKMGVWIFIFGAIITLIYDRFIQREDQLLINYPLIGRMRYLFYLLRDPMRQYFGDEPFYESYDKVKWVYDTAKEKNPYLSFSPSQPQKSARLSLKNANIVLNSDEVDSDFQVVFGESLKYPFTAHSVIGRSAMSDGALSPEATRAFSKAAFKGRFPINTGEGGLTSNFLTTLQLQKDCGYLEIKEGTWFAKSIYKVIKFIFNQSRARKIYCDLILQTKAKDSYIFDEKSISLYRIDWSVPLANFPLQVPKELPNITFQIGSGLYGVKDSNGEFDPIRYQKVMSFCVMSEIKIAQGAKQTGGKLLACKVSESVAYYRGVKPHVDLISPNRFPYANSIEELFEFIGRLKDLSQKPVGIKIVISSKEDFKEYAKMIKKSIENGTNQYPDFITIDGGDGGSATAPLEMMMSVGMVIAKALYVVDSTLKEYEIRDRIRLIASEKVLTPDDAVVLLGIGADFINIARGFMLSAGCIRARVCSGAGGRDCPVGIATNNPKKRASFLVEKRAYEIASYHQALKNGIVNLLAIMGVESLGELSKENLIFKDHTGKTYTDVERYFEEMMV